MRCWDSVGIRVAHFDRQRDDSNAVYHTSKLFFRDDDDGALSLQSRCLKRANAHTTYHLFLFLSPSLTR